ncbi:MAG: hypothetical protein CFH34_01182 [Alphaproteobacteria bacterium MarineAlpha9_Bin4]|nr:hypothetical protein [Pelagibacterales bacterium]PPR26010.1 MAG: hypothetical protein CFH34_01182 [Alphaproteobacteria bacterium MarineAlpha9_Bin4]|tara:strand:- start:97 stop:486 length:390 start_codon:yes stop_codon:yes gene_type:complete
MHCNSLNNNHTNILSSSKKTQLFRKNQTIYSEKEKINNIFIILDGFVESSSSKKCSQKKITLQKGSSLGLIDTILDRPYSRNMCAKSTVSLAVIDKDFLKDILFNNSFSSVLIKSLVIDIDNKYPHTWS